MAQLSKVFFPYDPLPAQDLNDMVGFINGVADGSNLETGAVTADKRSGGFAAGQLTITSVTGDLSVTGLGFRPKKVRFSWLASNNTGGTINGTTGIGFGRMTDTFQSCEVTASRPGRGYAMSDRSTARVIWDVVIPASDPANNRVIASRGSLDADGFTLNVTLGDTLTVYYEAEA